MPVSYTHLDVYKRQSLTIRELTLIINAPINDAINAEQTLNVESGTLTISAADDAIHSDLVLNIGAEGTDGPTITVTACYEGLELSLIHIYVYKRQPCSRL